MFSKNKRLTATAIIVAAGNSSRMGEGVNKQFLMINNIPVLAHTLLKFEMASLIDDVIVVTKPEYILTVQDMIKEFKITKVTDIISGGKTRQESVECGLNLVSNSSLVAIHDGARPFVSPEKIDELVSFAQQEGAVAPGITPKDTVKILSENGIVSDTPDRDSLRLIQTPQVFNADVIKLAYIRAKESGFTGTDDCSIAENSQVAVHIIDGESTNIKVTTPEDLPIAEAICNYLNRK